MADQMSRDTFCSIVETSYIPYALTVCESVRRFDRDILFHVFVTDHSGPFTELEARHPNTRFLSTDQVCASGVALELYQAYRHSSMDSFRQSMKSALMLYLLEHDGFDKVLFVDADLFFYHDFHFLFDALTEHAVLLTPHWRSSIDPSMDFNMFQTIFTDGLFNGGFVGASRRGADAMRWWASVCVRLCVIERTRGLFGDQTYLNLLPVLFEHILVLKHRGCNVAHWNLQDCPRTLVDGEVLIDGRFPVVFVHFTRSTIEGIVNGEDPLLSPHLKDYEQVLLHHEARFDLQRYVRPGTEEPVAPPRKKTWVQKGMDFLRIRTRIRKFLEG